MKSYRSHITYFKSEHVMNAVLVMKSAENKLDIITLIRISGRRARSGLRDRWTLETLNKVFWL